MRAIAPLAEIAHANASAGAVIPGAIVSPVLALDRLGPGTAPGSDAAPEAAEPVPAAPEPVSSAPGGFDIFAVHQRLIGDYRDFTMNAAVIRNPRILNEMEKSLDGREARPGGRRSATTPRTSC